MDWDLGTNGLLYLAAMSVVAGLVAHLLAGRRVARWFGAAVAAVTFAVGLFFSEVLFGWATEEELQPNIDGLSRDEALLGAVIVVAAAVFGARRWARRHDPDAHARHQPRHVAHR
jgi:hypothetical protein